MTVTLEQIAAGIKTRLDTISGLYAYDHPVAEPNFPAAAAVIPAINYRVAMGAGVITLPFEIHLLGSIGAGHEGQKKLWPFLDWTGDQSILLAINGDKTLGISNKVDANVMSARPLTLEEAAALQAFGAAIEMLVVVTNRE